MATVAVEVSEDPIRLVAETLNVYCNPLVKELVNVQASGVGKGIFNVQVKDGLNGTPFSSKASTSYLVIGDPPVLGAVKLTVAEAFPADATIFVGVEGLPTGVTVADGVELAELPTEFLATAVNV
jgi:hypothetical protein